MIYVILFWLCFALLVFWHFRNTRPITVFRWGFVDLWLSILQAKDHCTSTKRTLTGAEFNGEYGLGAIAACFSVVVPLLAAIVASIYYAL